MEKWNFMQLAKFVSCNRVNLRIIETISISKERVESWYFPDGRTALAQQKRNKQSGAALALGALVTQVLPRVAYLGFTIHHTTRYLPSAAIHNALDGISNHSHITSLHLLNVPKEEQLTIYSIELKYFKCNYRIQFWKHEGFNERRQGTKASYSGRITHKMKDIIKVFITDMEQLSKKRVIYLCFDFIKNVTDQLMLCNCSNLVLVTPELAKPLNTSSEADLQHQLHILQHASQAWKTQLYDQQIGKLRRRSAVYKRPQIPANHGDESPPKKVLPDTCERYTTRKGQLRNLDSNLNSPIQILSSEYVSSDGELAEQEAQESEAIQDLLDELHQKPKTSRKNSKKRKPDKLAQADTNVQTMYALGEITPRRPRHVATLAPIKSGNEAQSFGSVARSVTQMRPERKPSDESVKIPDFAFNDYFKEMIYKDFQRDRKQELMKKKLGCFKAKKSFGSKTERKFGIGNIQLQIDPQSRQFVRNESSQRATSPVKLKRSTTLQQIEQLLKTEEFERKKQAQAVKAAQMMNELVLPYHLSPHDTKAKILFADAEIAISDSDSLSHVDESSLIDLEPPKTTRSQVSLRYGMSPRSTHNFADELSKRSLLTIDQSYTTKYSSLMSPRSKSTFRFIDKEVKPVKLPVVSSPYFEHKGRNARKLLRKLKRRKKAV